MYRYVQMSFQPAYLFLAYWFGRMSHVLMPLKMYVKPALQFILKKVPVLSNQILLTTKLEMSQTSNLLVLVNLQVPLNRRQVVQNLMEVLSLIMCFNAKMMYVSNLNISTM